MKNFLIGSQRGKAKNNLCVHKTEKLSIYVWVVISCELIKKNKTQYFAKGPAYLALNISETLLEILMKAGGNSQETEFLPFHLDNCMNNEKVPSSNELSQSF